MSHTAEVREEGGSRRRWSWWATGLLLVALLLQGAASMWLGSRGWFSGELIHYYVARGGAPGGDEGLMEPHAGQWQPMLIVISLLIFRLVGLTTYVPFLVLAVVAHLVLVLLLHRLLVRLGARPVTALVVAVALLTYGGGSEAFLVASSAALTASIALGVLAALVLERGDWAWRSAVTAGFLLLLAVMTSLGGVVAAFWVVLFSLSRGPVAALRVVPLPAVALIGWFQVWDRDSWRVLVERTDIGEVPLAVWGLLSTPFDDIAGGVGVGGALLVGVTVLAVAARRSRPDLAWLAVAGLGAALLQGLLGALDHRADLVPAGRDRFVVLLLLLPALALAADHVSDVARVRLRPALRGLAVLGVAVAIAAALVHAWTGQHRVAQRIEVAGDRSRSLVAGALLAAETGERPVRETSAGTSVSGRDLRRLLDPQLLDELPELDPTEEDRILAESLYFVEVTQDKHLERARAARVWSDSFREPVRNAAGCRVHEATGPRPTLTLESYLGTGFSVRSDASTVTTTLTRPDLDLGSDPVTWSTEPGRWTHIATTAQLVRLQVRFDAAGRYTICLR